MTQIAVDDRIGRNPGRWSSSDAFYEELIARNRGIVPDEEQRRLRRATILVAGCGSIGGSAVEPLVRLGAEHLVLAEPDVYEVNNLNRQHAYLSDVGLGKAAVLAGHARAINPYAEVSIDDRGVVADNVVSLVGSSALIIDGVDVTARGPLACKYALHEEAQRQHVPVISGYDIAGVQLVLVYDYRRAATAVLGGRVAAADAGRLAPLEYLARVVPLRALPHEIIPELERQLRGESEGFPQVVYSAQLFGVLAARLALDLLAGRPVRKRIVVDVHHLPRSAAARGRARVARVAALWRLSRTARAYRAGVGGGEPGGMSR